MGMYGERLGRGVTREAARKYDGHGGNAGRPAAAPEW